MNRTILLPAVLMLSAGILNGCSNISTVASDAEAELAEREADLSARETALERKLNDLAAREKTLASASMQTEPGTDKTAAPASADDMLLPPSAKPGECYTRVWSEPRYQQTTERVLVQEESSRFEIVPATYRTVSKQVLVKEESEKLVYVPATFKTIKERIVLKPAGEKLIQVPAVYETVSERILDKPEHTVWKKGRGLIQRIDETTGEIMCLVTVPASYKTIKKRILKSPATTKMVKQPEVFKIVERQVVDQPAYTKTVVVPAVYKTIEIEEVVSAASQREIKIPALYTTVNQRKKVSDGHMQWRSILCETNTTKERVQRIQQALLDKGFDPGPIDGDVGSRTMAAINAYQRAQGLPVDEYLNIETVRSLGVEPQ